MPDIISGSKGETVLLMGNEAIARGMLEAGISVAAAYPGTPSTEIVEALSRVAKKAGIYVEWSTNEKVALEVAVGASMCGLRTAAVMKHVGVNVAADPLMSVGYSGVEGGLVIVTADDPNAHSSQNEQDNRFYGLHAYIPIFEPSSPGEAKDLTRDIYEISEKYKTAVFLRSTTRISHVRGNVTLGDVPKPKSKGKFHRDYSRWVLLPVNSRRLHQEAIDRIEKLSFIVEWQVKIFAKEESISNTIHGKNILPRVKELNTSIVASTIATLRQIKLKPYTSHKPSLKLPPRPPTMCPGCGHRATYYEIKIASAKSKIKAVYPGDIGCYTLGFFPPYRLVDISYSMGSGLGIGLGISHATDEIVIATIGDSTFFHAGIPALNHRRFHLFPCWHTSINKRCL